MNKWLVWARVLFCLALRKPALWAVDLMVLLFLLTFAGSVLPYAENKEVVFFGGGPAAERLGSDSIFHFFPAKSREEAEELVLSGRADCGFVFPETEGEPVMFLYSGFTIKGAAAKETVFRALYPDIVSKSLKEEEKSIFGSQAEAVSGALQERYRAYLESDAVFSVEFLSEGSISERQDGQLVLPWWALLLLFLLSLGLFLRPAAKSPFVRRLYPKDRGVFLLLYGFVCGLVLSLPYIALFPFFHGQLF